MAGETVENSKRGSDFQYLDIKGSTYEHYIHTHVHAMCLPSIGSVVPR